MAKPTESIFPIEHGKLTTDLDANNLQIINLDASNLPGGGGGNDTGTTTAILKGDGSHGFADAVADVDYASVGSVSGLETSASHDADMTTLTGLISVNTDDITNLTIEVNNKADTTALTAGLALKEDITDHDADITSVNTAISDVVGDVTALTTEVGNKADSASVSTALAGKEPTLPTTVNDNYILARRNASGTNQWFFVDPVTLGSTNATYTDGITHSNTTFNSTLAVFSASDTGLTIVASGNIPADTTITFVNATTVTLSNAATTTATGVSFTILNRFLPSGGSGTVTSVGVDMHSWLDLFSTSVGNASTTPVISFTQNNTIGANRFYGNFTAFTGTAGFGTAAVARTSLGGTTVGQAIFQLTNPSQVGFIRTNADNSVTALTSANTLTAIGGESALTFSSPLTRTLNAIAIPAAASVPAQVSGYLTGADHAAFSAKASSAITITTTAPLSIGGVSGGNANLTANRTIAMPASTGNADGTSQVDGYLTGADHTLFANKPPNSRTIATTSPLSIGGVVGGTSDLSANRTLAIQKADATHDGYLASTDFNNFSLGSPQAATLPATGTVTIGITSPPVNRLIFLTAITTPGLTVVLPSAGSYGATVGYPFIEFVDLVTGGAMANFGVTLQAPSGQTIDGFSSITLPRGTGYLRVNSNGTTRWTSTKYYTSSFTDPLDATKQVTVNVSNVPTGTTRVWSPAAGGNSGSVQDRPRVSGQFLSAYDMLSGALSTDVVHAYDLELTQYNITSGAITANVATVPNTGQVDNVRLSAALAAPLTVTWPQALGYGTGERVLFYDPAGVISDTNTVTITNGTDTFNVAGSAGGSSVLIKEPGAVRTAIAEPTTNTWTFTPFSGANNGTTIAFTTVPEDTINHKLTWTVANGVNQQTATATISGNDELVINGAVAGMHFDLFLTQGGAGGNAITLPFGSYTPNNGLGLLTLSSAVAAVDKLIGVFYGTSWTWDAVLNYTKKAIVTCSTVDVINGTGTATLTIANGTGSVYQATRFTPGANYNLCRVDAGLFYTGTAVAGQTVKIELRADVAGVPATTTIATSGSVDATTFSSLNTAVAAVATPTRFDFVTAPAVFSATPYWIVAHVSSFNSANHPNWASQATGAIHCFKAPEPGTVWTDQGSGLKLYFKSYHS